jgi:peptide/nickel transport system permease protein
MANVETVERDFSPVAPRVNEFRRFTRVFFSRWLVRIGLVLTILSLILAIFAPLIAPYDPDKENLKQTFMQPSSQHLLGTDSHGRDTLSRVIYGARVSVTVAFGSILLSAILGITLGVAAGYFGGWTYTIIMRFTDAMMAFPSMLFALAISAMLGGGLFNIILALGISLEPSFCRLMCAQVLTVKEREFITAEKSIGSNHLRIIALHVVPNGFPALIVQVSLWMGWAILTEAGLSFLGVGIAPPTASWGNMISEGYRYLVKSPILSFAPGLVCMMTVFGYNMIADGLRDALDPSLRGKL